MFLNGHRGRRRRRDRCDAFRWHARLSPDVACGRYVVVVENADDQFSACDFVKGPQVSGCSRSKVPSMYAIGRVWTDPFSTVAFDRSYRARTRPRPHLSFPIIQYRCVSGIFVKIVRMKASASCRRRDTLRRRRACVIEGNVSYRVETFRSNRNRNTTRRKSSRRRKRDRGRETRIRNR